MSIYHPGDMRNLSKTIVSEKVTLIDKELNMNKIQNWPWFCTGMICAIVAVYLGFQCLFGEAWSIFSWLWKLPVGVFAAMAATVFIDVGVNGDRPPR